MVRAANPSEQREFTARVVELIRRQYVKRPRFPNLVETEISTMKCFAFQLPATALQIDSGMITEIIVHYGENSADQNKLTANVWAKRESGVAIDFLMSIHLPAQEDEPPMEQVNRIFAALNENAVFKEKLFDFITGQLELNDGSMKPS